MTALVAAIAIVTLGGLTAWAFWLDQTNSIGILADLSTVDFACRTLAILFGGT